MFRRVVIGLATAAVGVVLTAGPVAAATRSVGSESAGREASAGRISFENLGGPFGITRAHGSYEESAGYLIGEISG